MRENTELACHCLQKPVAEIGLPQRSDKRESNNTLGEPIVRRQGKAKRAPDRPWACKLIGKPRS